MDAKLQSQVLIESLPYLRKFHGETVVIKYGGHAMKDEALKAAFARNIALLKLVGIHPVVVHGGGPQIGNMLEKLEIRSEFREGLRVTDDATMNVVEMVLVGSVNKDIVNQINRAGARAVGLSGKDGMLLHAEKKAMVVTRENQPPEIIDLGNVGRVTRVETTLIFSLMKDGFVPVIAPVGVDDEGHTYNINADAVAGAVAGALRARRLIMLTDVAGVLDPEGKLIQSIRVEDAAGLYENGTVTGGMISALNRSVTIQGSSSVNTMSLIQMDASVSPGNSGGGLFNMNGELVGIVNAKSSSSDAEGLGFAIPINDAIKVAQELLENGYVTGRPYLGITYLAVTDAQTASQLGVNAYGVYVVEVVKGGPAEKAGLQAGDRIVSVDGTEIASKDDLGTLMQKHAAGDTLSITIARDGQMQTVNVTLGEKTASNS